MRSKLHLTAICLVAFLMISLLATGNVCSLTNPGLAAPDSGVTELTAVCTLITGDVLHVTRLKDGRYIIAAASNKRAFQMISLNSDTYVIPADVERFINRHLDMQLFNIDYLVENGYCDAKMTTLPVIIEYTKNPGKMHAKINTAPGLLKKREFKTVNASSAAVKKGDANEFARATFHTEGGLEGVEKIWLDRKVKLSLDESVPGIGAPYAWNQGFDGTGIKIAILDTGIWKDHPDLAGKVIAEEDFTEDGTPTDLFGHGTHCAGIAAANGTVKGVAPGASLINAKVLDKDGGGYISWAMAGWEWAAEQGAHVFSMSFGAGPTDGTDPWDIALNEIVESYNIVAVAAAGNFGEYYGVSSPAAADKVIAVGASMGYDPETAAIADFSSRGPRLDNAVKPEIVAPGVAINSTVPIGPCTLCDPSGYLELSGTSMSAPHIAGAAALLLQKHPEWKPMQIRDGLMSTARIMPGYDIYAQGSGLVAVDSAMDAVLVFEPAEINMGTIPSEIWRENPIQSKIFAIRNYGGEDITLDLSVGNVHDIKGETFDIATLDTNTVTVPAGGIETITLTVDLTTSPKNIPLGGRVIAKNGETGKEIHAIFGINKELKYELKIRMTDPEGMPWAWNLVIVADAVNPYPEGVALFTETDQDGEATVRVPPGIYNVFSAGPWLKEAVWPSFPVYWLHSIELPVPGDTSLILDAREAKPITLDMRVDATIPYASDAAIVYQIKDSPDTQGSIPDVQGAMWTVGGYRVDNYVLPATSATGQINGYVRFQEIRGSEFTDLFPVKSPVVYDLFFTMLGEITAPTVYRVDEKMLNEMALVKAKHFSTDINPREHQWGRFAFPTEFFVPGAGIAPLPYLVPIERDEYLTTDKASYMQVVIPSYDFTYSPWIWFTECLMGDPYVYWNVYETGERIEKTWLEQPIKPWAVTATRTDDTIRVGGYNPVTGTPGAYEAMDSGGNIAFLVPYGLTFETKAYKDDELIWTLPDAYDWVQQVTPEEADYRLELYSKNVPSVCLFCEGAFEPYWTSFSTETFTTIRFKSTYVEGTETLPIINLNYKIPGLGMNNVKFASRKCHKKGPLSIHIMPQSLKGLSISKVRFWYSYDDGATWTEVDRVVKGSGKWIAKPESQENYISIKTLATDAEGNSTEQTIMRAFYVTTKPQKCCSEP